MKRYLLLASLLFCSLSLRAQIVGDIGVTRKELCNRDGQLHLVLDIEVSRKAVTRSQSWMIIPELSTPDRRSVKLFPHVLVYGRYQQHMAERRQALTGAHRTERQPYAVISADNKTDQRIRYEMTIPYEGWMAGASLVVREILTNPGGRQRVFTIDVNGAVDTDTAAGSTDKEAGL